MKTVIYGQGQRVIDWVAPRVDEGPSEFAGAKAIGIEQDGELIGGVLYTHFTGASVSMHVAGEGKRWMTRDFLWRAFAYPFVQLRCRRVTGLVRADNIAAQRFDEHLGFRREGLIREATDDGCDLVVYGMLKRECRYLELMR